MTEQEIFEKMKSPELLIDPKEINNIISYIGGFLTHLELELDDLKIAYSFQWEAMKYGNREDLENKSTKPLTDKMTEIFMMRDPIYTKLNQTKRKLGELKRYRSDLRDKLNIIMNIRH